MSFFRRDPKAKTEKLKQRLQKDYAKKMESAMHALRNGDVRRNAELTQEAAQIREELVALDSPGG